MLTPEQILTMSRSLVGIYEQIQSDLLVNIASRFDAQDAITPNTVLEWQARMLEDLGGVRRGNLKIIAQLSQKTEGEVASLFSAAGIKTLELDEAIYQEAFAEGLLAHAPLPIGASTGVQQVLQGAVRSTRDYLNMVNTKAAQSADEAYLRIVNQVYLETSLGVTDYNTAMRKAVRQLADRGITGADYYWKDKDGFMHHRRDQLDVAARRNILSSTSRMTGDIQMARAKDWGCNFVETSSHAGARPEHAAWQGRVFCLEGETREYPNFAKVTGYGSIEGICGVNCRHTFYPFFPGISERVSQPYSKEANEKEYSQSQEQRKLEREIREQKRRILTAEAANNPEGVRAAQLKLREKEAEMKTFLAETGRRKESARQQVLGFGRSEAQKAVQAEKREAKDTNIKFVQAHSIAEAEEFARDKLGINGVYYKGLDLKTVNEINSAITSGMNYAPEISDSVQFTGSLQQLNKDIRNSKGFEDAILNDLAANNPTHSRESLRPYAQKQMQRFAGVVSSDTYAAARPKLELAGYPQTAQHYNSHYVGIGVNNVFGKNHSTFTESVMKDVAVGFHPEGTGSVKAIFDHEIGHKVDEALGLRSNADILRVYNALDSTKIKSELSEYATESIKEFIAEAYSEYLNNPTPRTIATQIGRIIDKITRR